MVIVVLLVLAYGLLTWAKLNDRFDGSWKAVSIYPASFLVAVGAVVAMLVVLLAAVVLLGGVLVANELSTWATEPPK